MNITVMAVARSVLKVRRRKRGARDVVSVFNELASIAYAHQCKFRHNSVQVNLIFASDELLEFGFVIDKFEKIAIWSYRGWRW